MTVREYFLKFVKLSRYATSLVSNSRDEMSRFLKGIAEDLEEECRAAMLHDNMDLSRLMVHVQQVEESRKRKQTRVGNKSRQADENFSRKSSTEIRDKPRFKKGLSRQGGVKFIQGSL